MSSMLSPPDSLHTARRDRNQRFLKTHLTSHELILVVAFVTLMLLVAYTAATHGMQPSDLPQKWLDTFVHQLYEGTKRFTWIAMYILVLFDILQALFCIGWYSNQLYPNTRYKDEKRRQERRIRLKNFFGKIVGCVQKRFGKDRNDKQSSATETKRSAHDTTRQTISSAVDIRPQKLTRKTNPHLAPYYPPTCHPLLHPDFSNVQRLALLTLWDVMIILTLSSHIYIFLTNIEPSRAMCRSPTLAHALSPRPDSPLLDSRDKCHRLNWRIHSAGGYSVGGAAILGVLHLFTLIFRFWEHIQASRSLGLGETASNRLKHFRKGKERSSMDDKHWRNPPRDIDVLERASSGPGDALPLSLSPSIQVYSVPSMAVTATRHQSTISQEELNAGVLQRGRVRMRRSRQQESEGVDHQSEHSRWEALLDTLIP